jgi:hypothetical protein
MTQADYLEERASHRRTLQRMAVAYTPLTLISGWLFIISLRSFIGGAVGAILPLIILGLLTAAFAVEGISALRDLRAEPTAMTGQVRRTWSRGGLLWFFRSHYMFVDKTVFTVAPLTALSVEPGDTVEVEHWPHTKTVIRVRLTERGQPQPRGWLSDGPSRSSR